MPTRDEIEAHLGDVLRRYPGVPQEVVRSLIGVESGWNPGARSPKGALGPMQLMPATARSLGVDPSDWRQNIEGGVRLLADELGHFGGDVGKALAAYHAGRPAVERAGGIPGTHDGIMSTEQYVRQILGAGPAQRTLPNRFAPADQRRYEPAHGWAQGMGDRPPPTRSLPPIEKPKAGLWEDTKNLLWGGTVGLAQDFRELVRSTLGDTVVGKIDDLDKAMTGKTLDERQAEAMDALSPEQAEALRKEWWDDEKGTFGPAVTDPRSWYGGLMQSLPGTAAVMLPAFRIARAVEKAALARAAASGLSADVAAAAASKAGARAALIAGSVLEGTQGGAQASRNVRDQILALPDEVLDQSEAFRALVDDLGGDRAAARRELADDRAGLALLGAGVVTGIFGGRGDQLLYGLLRRSESGPMWSRIGQGIVSEGVLEEFPQSFGSRVAENVAMQGADVSRGTMGGALSEGIGGLAVGGLMGAGMGAAFGRNLPPRSTVAPPAPQDEPPAAAPAAPPPAAGEPSDAEVAQRLAGVPELAPGDVGRPADGLPFKARIAAEGARARMGLKDTHEVVQLGDGWVIRKIDDAAAPALPVADNTAATAAPAPSEQVIPGLLVPSEGGPAPAEPTDQQEPADAVPIQVPAEVGVRDQPAVGEGVGGQDAQPAPPAGEGQQPVAAQPAEAPVAPVADEPRRSFASTQIALPGGIGQDVLRAAKKLIAKEDVHPTEGLEKRPHVTVKYGLHDDNADALREVLAGEPPVEGKITGIEIFSPENEDYDVVVARVESDDLVRLNAKIKAALPNTETFPEYKPHVTLGYVKKGAGQKYANAKLPIEGRSFMIDTLELSGIDETITPIRLTGTRAPEAEPAKAKKAPKQFAPGDSIEWNNPSEYPEYGGRWAGTVVAQDEHRLTVKVDSSPLGKNDGKTMDFGAPGSAAAFSFKLRKDADAVAPQKGSEKPAADAEQRGATPEETTDIAQAFDDAVTTANDGETQIHHLFDPPAKSDVVRLQDKVKVYVKDHGWMTPAEAKAKIKEWKKHAERQGATNRNADKVVLSLFDLTGAWSQPWEDAGYQVWRFDIQHDPEQGDVNNFSTDFFGDWFGAFEGQDIYAILAACPCTDFAVSGARHFAAKDKDGRTRSSVELVKQTLATIEFFKPSVWAIENPVGRIESLTGLPPWRLSFDPNHVGESYTKKTLLWGRFNADLPIAPVEPTEGSKMHQKYGGKSLATKNARSVTPEGFAYSFFMANNAVDHPVMALANKYDRLDPAAIKGAVDAGLSYKEVSDLVDDAYYIDLDDAKANKLLREAAAKGAQAKPEEPEAPKAPRQPKAPRSPEDKGRILLIRGLKQMGGIRSTEARDITGEPVVKANRLLPGLFRNAGHSMDRVAEWMHENGYMTDAEYEDVDGGMQRARDIVRDLLDKRPVVRIKDMDAVAERDFAEQMAEAYPDADLTSAEILDLLDSGDDLTTAEWEAAFDIDAALTAAGIMDDAARETIKERAAVAAENGVDYEAAAKTAIQRHLEGAQADRGEAQGEAPAAPTLELTGETNAEVLAREEAAKKAAEDKAKADAAAEARRRADAERDTFALSGSDRPADVLATRGQGDLLAEPPKAEAKPAPTKQEPLLQGATNVEDVGENLKFNRRNFARGGVTWDDIKDANAAFKKLEVQKPKVWPRPDYEGMVAGGTHEARLIARMVKQVYDGIAVEPPKADDDTLKGYIDAVQHVRDKLLAWSKDDDATRQFTSTLMAAVEDFKRNRWGHGGVAARELSRAFLETLWPGTPKGQAFRDSDAAKAARLLGGNRFLQAVQPDMDAFEKIAKDINDGWPAKQEAWQRQGYKVLAPGEYTITGQPAVRYNRETNAREETGDMAWTFTPKQGRHSWGKIAPKDAAPPSAEKYLLGLEHGFFVEQFDTREAAVERAREKVRAQRENKGQDIRGTNVGESERTGPERRPAGANVSSDQLKEVFGFRGVNFGRKGWIGDAERQAYLNAAYDGLHDLAELLGVPPRALSLNGMLGIAFGAQGRGGNAAAHFVPGVNEINLTKTMGAGTLAHEWGHALDHYFARRAGLDAHDEPYLSSHAEKSPTEQFYDRDKKGAGTRNRFAENLRPEVLAAFKSLVEAMHKRPQTPGEAEQQAAQTLAQSLKNVDRWLDAIKGNIRVKGKPEEAEFDALAERIRKGDLGDGMVSVGQLALPRVIGELRALTKRVNGRYEPADNMKGLDHAAGFLKHMLEKQEATATHEPQRTTTDYYRESAAKDREKKGKAYWATRWEMFARAFELFVADKLSEAGQGNTFLSDAQIRASKTEEVKDASSAFARGAGATKDVFVFPYPRGVDRTAINAAFQKLVDAIEHRESPDKPGQVELYSLDKGERAPLWRSALKESLAKAPFAKDGTIAAGQLVRWLEARSKDGTFKPDELEWSGLVDYLYTIMRPSSRTPLDERVKVARKDVEAFLDQNGVQVEETMLGGKYRYWAEPIRGERREFDDPDEASQYAGPGGQAGAIGEDGQIGPQPPKFPGYQLPGGKDYRELLLTLPPKKAPFKAPSSVEAWLVEQPWYQAWKSKGGDMEEAIRLYDQWIARERNNTEPTFRSGHFDEPNVLAHVRFNERTDAEGRRVLFIEEIQSDWAQQGRKRGFGGSLDELSKEWQAWQKAQGMEPSSADEISPDSVTPEQAAYIRNFVSRWDDAERGQQGVPRAPFVGKTEAWVALALKRMVRYAADNGFDAVAWTTGEQQAERYDLSKQIGEVTVEPLSNRAVGVEGDHYHVTAKTKDGRRVTDRAYPAAQLPDVIGKELAERAIKDIAAKGPVRGIGDFSVSYSGLDLKVGGEGMRGFYDKIVPKVANDILKKLGGGKVGTVPMWTTEWSVRKQDNGSWGVYDEGARRYVSSEYPTEAAAVARMEELKPLTQPGFDITPAMRAKAQEGMPLFAPERIDGTAVTGTVAPTQSERTAYTARLRRAAKLLEEGKVDEGRQVIDALLQAKERANRQNDMDRMVADRVRGVERTRELLHRWMRQGQIGREQGELGLWLLEQNPALANDLAATVKIKGREGSAGSYNPVDRLVTLIAGRGTDDTVAHELLHHAERMMPRDVQDGIREAWARELTDFERWAQAMGSDNARRAIGAVLRLNAGSTEAQAELMSMFQDGTLPQEFYALTNPSEYWAENGSRILQGRHAADQAGWVAKARRWLAEFIEKIKDIFGLPSDAAVLRGLRAVLRVGGQFVSREMLHEDPEGSGMRASRKGVLADIELNALDRVVAAQTVTDAGHRFANRLRDFRGLALQTLGRRQITDIYADMLPELRGYNTLAQQMDADKNETGAEADELARRWGKLPDERALAVLMHEATLEGIDPSETMVAGANRADYLRLRRQWDALTPEAQAVYREARDSYKRHYEAVQQAIREKIMRVLPDSERRAEMLEQLDANLFGRVRGVYFPLARFGDYLIVVKDAAGNTKSVTFPEKMNEAEETRRLLQREAAPGDRVGKVQKRAEFNAARDAVGRGFLQQLYGVLDQHGAASGDLIDAINQLYLVSLPDLSWAKHGLHRKGTPGFSQDARRAYADNVFHGARYLAKLRYADRLEDSLRAMEERIKAEADNEDFDGVKAQQVVDEMRKRHDFFMSPDTTQLATAMTSVGFVWYLGLSPASAAVNLSQTALVAYPLLAAKHGAAKAARMLLAASTQTAGAKNDLRTVLRGDEATALAEAIRSGVIDVTLAHDLAGIASGEDAKVMWRLRPVMRAASLLFHEAEKFNRQATFLAAYRLARAAGRDHAAAYSEAVEDTYASHFDYSAGNRPRVMQGNVARVVLLFKQFAQNMIYVIARNAYLAVKGDRDAAKALAGVLASHALAAGVLGLPVVGPLLAMATLIGGDDDEPWTAEVALRNALADAIGPKPAEALLRGLSRLTPWDISGRVGLDRLLLPDVQEGLEGARLANQIATSALGPVAGIGVNALRGLEYLADGHVLRGWETMMPSFLRSLLRSYRFMSEGDVDRTGLEIAGEMSMPEWLGQAAGFRPSRSASVQEAKGAVYQADRKLNERRQGLVTALALAMRAEDAAGVAEARAAIRRFNEKNPSRRITPDTIARSMRMREKRQREAERGIYLPRSRQDVRELGRFAAD